MNQHPALPIQPPPNRIPHALKHRFRAPQNPRETIDRLKQPLIINPILQLPHVAIPLHALLQCRLGGSLGPTVEFARPDPEGGAEAVALGTVGVVCEDVGFQLRRGGQVAVDLGVGCG